jgi:DNA-binding NtrC family response regulator
MEVFTYTNPNACLEALAGLAPDIIISDLRMPELSGIEFLVQSRELAPSAVRILLSAHAERDGLIRAINDAGIFQFIEKPWNDDELMVTVFQALRVRQTAAAHPPEKDADGALSGNVDPRIEELIRLEQESPGISRVDLDEDGYIKLSP